MRISDVYEYDPWTALQHVLTEAKQRNPSAGAFMWQSRMGLDGVRYGSYRGINNESLKGRTYLIEFLDYAVGIFWLDELHDPRAHKNVPLENL